MHNLPFTETFLLLILVGVFSSLLASMIGLGGGLVAIPLISLVVGWDHSLQAKLISYASVLALSIFSSVKYFFQKRLPNFKAAFWILIGVIPATVICNIFVGPLFANIPKWVFHICYACVTFAVIILINLKDKISLKAPIKYYYLPICGLVVGILSGSFGLSGGVLFVPILAIGLKLPAKDIAVNSLALKLVTSFVNVIADLASGQYQSFEEHSVYWWAPLVIIIGAFIGSQIGPMFNKKMSNKQISIAFNIVLGAVLIWEITSVILMKENII